MGGPLYHPVKSGVQKLAEILYGIVQGWTRKLNCSLHVYVVLLVIWHLRNSALLIQKMGFYWLLLIDRVRGYFARCS
jgi:hypothetical protein